jgi:hypothetical protein
MRLISWVDNSDNESGFRVTFSMRDNVQSATVISETYTAGTDATSVTISETAARLSGDLLEITVVAFNDAGDSAPATFALALDAGPAATATPSVPTPRLPGTGAASAPYSVDLSAEPLIRVGTVALVLGSLALALGSRLRRQS